MKITGTSNIPSSSLTASSPELLSARRISARIMPSRFALAKVIDSACVRAIPTTRGRATRPGFPVPWRSSARLDDEDVGSDFDCHFTPGFVSQPAQFGDIHRKDLRRSLFREILQRKQKKCLARAWRDPLEMSLRPAQRAFVVIRQGVDAN